MLPTLINNVVLLNSIVMEGLKEHHNAIVLRGFKGYPELGIHYAERRRSLEIFFHFFLDWVLNLNSLWLVCLWYHEVCYNMRKRFGDLEWFIDSYQLYIYLYILWWFIYSYQLYIYLYILWWFIYSYQLYIYLYILWWFIYSNLLYIYLFIPWWFIYSY